VKWSGAVHIRMEKRSGMEQVDDGSRWVGWRREEEENKATRGRWRRDKLKYGLHGTGWLAEGRTTAAHDDVGGMWMDCECQDVGWGNTTTRWDHGNRGDNGALWAWIGGQSVEF